MQRGQSQARAGKRISAAVVVDQVDYPMFEVDQVTPDGARLRGPLVFERGETVTLRLTFGDGSTVDVVAAVERVSLGEVGEVEVRLPREDDRDHVASKLR